MTTAATEAGGAAGEGGRDEPLVARAGNRRIDEQPEGLRHAEGVEYQVVSIDAELDLMRRFYSAAIDVARRAVPRRDRAAAIRAIRRELKAAILAVTTRHRNEKASRRAAIKRLSEVRDHPAIK